ncbi:MAG TPA: hypothetical protein VFJ50_00450 [Gemmatimonadales bacterium]|nr:hypothetical protein [Gemmatimonadales bacterium]
MIDVDCYVFGGVTHRRFEFTEGRGARDALTGFLQTIDAGIYLLGSVEGFSVDPADHYGWLDA